MFVSITKQLNNNNNKTGSSLPIPKQKQTIMINIFII